MNWSAEPPAPAAGARAAPRRTEGPAQGPGSVDTGGERAPHIRHRPFWVALPSASSCRGPPLREPDGQDDPSDLEQTDGRGRHLDSAGNPALRGTGHHAHDAEQKAGEKEHLEKKTSALRN